MSDAITVNRADLRTPGDVLHRQVNRAVDLLAAFLDNHTHTEFITNHRTKVHHHDDRVEGSPPE